MGRCSMCGPATAGKVHPTASKRTICSTGRCWILPRWSVRMRYPDVARRARSISPGSLRGKTPLSFLCDASKCATFLPLRRQTQAVNQGGMCPSDTYQRVVARANGLYKGIHEIEVGAPVSAHACTLG
eukprot:m.85935 g.85935  ORF g.85935 m.85935 type:complete len:128 (+) comp16372_c0_seq1:1461-1844(+)